MNEPTLAFLAEQQRLLISYVATMREDLTVMMEILRRIEHALSSIGAQLTAMHAYNRRVEERVAHLETAKE